MRDARMAERPLRTPAVYTRTMSSPLLDRLAATPSMVAHLVVEADGAALAAETPDGWSALTTLAHLRDTEYLVHRLALERLLAEEEPRLAPFDDVAWRGGRNRTRDRKELLLADFALQRQASLTILRGLRPEDWERRGSAPDGTMLTVAGLVERWLRADERHVGVLEGIAGETYAEAVERRRRREE
jgi:hypothetical protein